MSYKIIFDDGTYIDNLSRHSNSFVSPVEVTPEMFEGKMRHITIEGPEDEYGLIGEHIGMQLCGIHHHTIEEGVPEGWYIILLDIPENVLRQKQIRGDIEYLAMMMDVEL